MKLKCYVVTVKETGEQFHSCSKKKIDKWISDYTESTTNQDEPWEPHFEETEETIE